MLSQRKKTSLLIIEDVADDRAILARRFTGLGFEISYAESGEEALELIERDGFDLVFLDILMPGISGFEVLKSIRERHSKQELPIIVVTTEGEANKAAEALANGANDYVVKPDFKTATAKAWAHIERTRRR